MGLASAVRGRAECIADRATGRPITPASRFGIASASKLFTAVALVRRPAIGFLGVFFFAILAPTSLVPGTRQTLAEHRMYLALAPVVVLLVLGSDKWLGRRGRVVLAAAAVGLGWLTVRDLAGHRGQAAGQRHRPQ